MSYFTQLAFLKLKRFRHSALCRNIVYYAIQAKPSLSLSITLHVIIALVISINLTFSYSYRFNKNNRDKVVLIDLVPLANISNIQIASDSGKKNHSKGGKPEKLKTQQQVLLKKGGEKIPLKGKNVQRIKKKPLETQPITSKNQGSKLQSALKAIKTAENKTPINVDTQPKKGIIGKGKAPYNKLKPQTINVIESIRSQFIHCWSVPYGALNVENLLVSININLDMHGKVIGVNVTDMKQYNRNPFFRAMADSAIRAIYKCSPLQGLPHAKYNLWKDIDLIFSAKDMFL